MKKLFYTLLLVLPVAACQNSGTPGNQPTAADSTSVEKEMSVAQTACYIRALGQDTTWVKITIAADGSVSGTYDWVPFEKDSARGTLSGKKEGDLLKLLYDYTIEGSQQQQEMLMKMSGGQLAEGEGELMEAENGVLVFKDPANVKYLPLVEINCP